MWWPARCVVTAGVRVQRVRYTHRGWNGPREDPLHDALRMLDALRREAYDIPVVLLGHSMGARAALHAASTTRWSAPWWASPRGARPATR